MGCTRSKLNNKICESSETEETHKRFIREKGLDNYYKVMGYNKDKAHNMDDHSSTYNVGLLNFDSKSESETEYQYSGLSTKEYVAIAVGILIVAYAGRRLIRYINKKKKKTSAKKATVLKEIVEEATKPPTTYPTAPPQTMTTSFGQPVTTIAIPQNQQKALEKAVIPVNMSRMPIFSNSLYE